MTIDWSHMKTPEEILAEQQEQVRVERRRAYAEEVAPLFIEAQYAAVTTQQPVDNSTWVAKLEEINARYPMPE